MRDQESHGMAYSAEYRVWCNMRQRCANPKNNSYPFYGGRGIRVCDRWFNSFEAFIADMGKRPSDDHTLERKNVDGNYEADNCIWALRSVQYSNRRSNVMVSLNGEILTLAQAAVKLGITPNALYRRLGRGIPLEEALTSDRLERNVTRYEHKGERLTLGEWAKRLGFTPDSMRRRLVGKEQTIQQVIENMPKPPSDPD